MIEPEDFMKFSKALLHHDFESKETVYRTVIGRAYYSAFLFARERLKTCRGITFPHGAEEHEKVVSSLRDLNIKNSRLCGDMLASLRDERNHCDYHINYDISKEDATDNLDQAKAIIQNIKETLQE